jgi:hypothetical protein
MIENGGTSRLYVLRARLQTSKPVRNAPRKERTSCAGQLTTLHVPDSTSTIAWGINDYGQIVGNYVDSENKTRGFFATPAP